MSKKEAKQLSCSFLVALLITMQLINEQYANAQNNY